MQSDEVPGTDALGDADDIADAQSGQGRGGADGEQQLPARLHRRGKRTEMIVELSRRDRVEQRALVPVLRQTAAQAHAATVNSPLPIEALSLRITATGSSCGPAT
jgi:hypothetical protein